MRMQALARLRVRETHGIRRFLYPLRAHVELPPSLITGVPRPTWRLAGEDDAPLPWQMVVARGRMFLEFAVSLAPGEEQIITLSEGDAEFVLSDPLHVIQTADGALHNEQKLFAVTVTPEGAIADVVYERARHLRGPSGITRNGRPPRTQSTTATTGPSLSLNAYLTARAAYSDGCGGDTQVGITAAKSWATVTHTLDKALPGDEIVFTLPLALTSPTPSADFGIGGGLYAPLRPGTTGTVVWRTEFDKGQADWSLATDGRIDYMGSVTAEGLKAQQWFHVLDGPKSLAVTISHVSPQCAVQTVSLAADGTVSVAFVLGKSARGPAEFAVCWHFLNNTPAIAAATNPQSILLPPTVEVLPL